MWLVALQCTIGRIRIRLRHGTNVPCGNQRLACVIYGLCSHVLVQVDWMTVTEWVLIRGQCMHKARTSRDLKGILTYWAFLSVGPAPRTAKGYAVRDWSSFQLNRACLHTVSTTCTILIRPESAGMQACAPARLCREDVRFASIFLFGGLSFNLHCSWYFLE